MLSMSLWLVGFAQYYRPMQEDDALLWAKITLTLGIMNAAFFFHSICAVVRRMWRLRWWIALSYLTGIVNVVLLWDGQLLHGIRSAPFMHHYVNYNRAWYPLLTSHIVLWQWLAAGVLVYSAWRASGYRRTQLAYFSVAWFVTFLTGTFIIVPLEYEIYIPPFGFFLMPVNLALLTYVAGKARLADFNAVTLLVTVAASVLIIGGLALAAPGFVTLDQVLFTVTLVVCVALGLTITLPRFLPRAERMMQERMFGKRYGYQDAVAGLVKELSLVPDIDQLLGRVAAIVHSQMQLSRVVVLMQDPLSGEFALRAQSGLTAEELAGRTGLPEQAAVAGWLQQNKDALVRDELPRRVDAKMLQSLTGELDQLKIAVCVPMILDQKLVGMLCLGEKLNREMFFASDLKLLETLAAEVSLAVRYRRMEEEIFRKNKLIELGTIAAGVAHEIRNPLSSIRTFAQLLPERMGDAEFQQEFSRHVLKDVDRITMVVESMLQFARPAQIVIAEHSVNDLVDEAIVLVHSKLKAKQIELTRQFHGQPSVKADKNQVLQVLINLLSNAADALPQQGKIRVATGERTMEMGDGDNRLRRYIVIEVADNGPGIPAAVRNRLFDPFFTTKKEGTGLGLSISQKIVRDHGGVITVSSVEGRGTSFQVNLPVDGPPQTVTQ
jgi:signal transduction histidine kinase